MDIFFEVHQDLPREGPGDEASTSRAFQLLEGLPAQPRVLDVGCGPGAQTLQLARMSFGSIYALDTHLPFLRVLYQQAREQNLTGRVMPLRMSMCNLGFPPSSFDLIWSEGAIYIRSFADGLRAFYDLLKPGGYAAVTEISWIRPDPPQEVAVFWKEAYPGMQTREENLDVVRSLGFQLLGDFALPDSAWLDNYYGPMAKRIALLRKKYAGDAGIQHQLDEEEREIDLYQKYSSWYGYVFYLMRKPDDNR